MVTMLEQIVQGMVKIIQGKGRCSKFKSRGLIVESFDCGLVLRSLKFVRRQ
jgi:hypothetical protein